VAISFCYFYCTKEKRGTHLNNLSLYFDFDIDGYFKWEEECHIDEKRFGAVIARYIVPFFNTCLFNI
jgi:hypothetical protein